GGTDTVVTNGDQTDTAYDGMSKGLTFEQSLRSRTFEPDGPNYTPRISSVLHIDSGKFCYEMSILKSDMGDPESSNRYTFSYENPKKGVGRFIHTYRGDGNPLPSFEGEPVAVSLDGMNDAKTLADKMWQNLNADNKVSLFVRYIEIASGKEETVIINKNK
ncbi:MAG: inosine monophosphate cyclohydrolase, partial [Treponema sp.]|nr:inosine monophosphate cyclohydrolase [Treponema sp.]